jgi:hypothetical protein
MQNQKDQSKQRRGFYTILFFLVTAIGGWKLYRGQHQTAYTLFGASFLPWLTEVVAKSLSEKLFQRWMKFGELLGTVNTYIIVTILYFGMLTPVGLFLRLTGKARAYERDSKKKRSSWLSISDPRPLAERYTTPY